VNDKPDPAAAAASVKQAADIAEQKPVVNTDELDAALRSKKRVSRDSLVIAPALAGLQNGTGLQIPGGASNGVY
jgi:hypothetical protein